MEDDRLCQVYTYISLIRNHHINTNKFQTSENITHSKETFISVTPMYNEGFDIVVCFGTGKMV